MKKNILLLFLAFHIVVATAQVKGIVKDKAGNAVPGVSVRWENENTGVATNVHGMFEIAVSNTTNKLILSNVVYVADTLTVSVNDSVSTLLHVTMNDVRQLNEVDITARSKGVLRNHVTPLNVQTVTSHELKRAACCNLSESFETNASVDVSYDDVVTGAKQIKLLGLSGKYVQILTENVPNLRGLSSSYGLGFIPGPWMESIQISKGVASVKNGYEAIAGQINVEYKKPKNSDPLSLNAYLNSAGRTEFNATSGLKLKENLFTGIFMHVSDELVKLDINKDGYIDMPMVKQYNFANRWHYENDGYIMQAMIRALSEKRMGGLIDRSYKVGVNTERYEFFLKNGLIFNTYSHEGESEENGFNSSLGLILESFGSSSGCARSD
ncbi:MAG: carboxypeptidase-like regulatory domain-containing protein [Paludibacteraceae bacterium]